MMCYRDKTFCSYYKECLKGGHCRRALTEQIQQNGEKWSKQFGTNEILICQYAEKPECFQERR